MGTLFKMSFSALLFHTDKFTFTIVCSYNYFAQPSCFPDKAVRRDVDSLEVQCSNWKLGCKWVGQLIKYFQVNFTCTLNHVAAIKF